jgi:outer membrane protein assembly factor BamB
MYLPTDLAVVPILVSGGAALLPAIIAGIVSVFALLFKPRELFAACKRRPLVPILILGLAVAIPLVVHFFPTGEAPTAGGRSAQASAGVTTDWRAVALEVIRQEKLGDRPAAATTPATIPQPAYAADAADAEPVILGRTATRTHHDGSPAPLGLQEVARYIDEVDGPSAMILASPVVSGNAVYGGTTVLDPPSNYGTLFRLDRETLKPMWVVSDLVDPATNETIELKGIFATPALTADGNRLIAGQGLHPDFNCDLVCLDTETGKLVWRVKTELHIESSPAIEGDLVVVGCGAIEDPNDYTRLLSHPGYVLAVRISDGQKMWRYDLADPESSPALVDGVVYIGSGFNGKAIVALRTETDEELEAQGLDRLIWSTPTPYPMTGPVTVAGDLIVAGGGNGNFVFSHPNPAGVVVALDRATGEVRWETEIGDSGLGSIAFKDGVLICGSRTGEVLSISPDDGTILWRNNIGGGSPIVAGPAFTGDKIYISTGNGVLKVLDAHDEGKVLESHFLNDPTRAGEFGLTASSPGVVGADVFVGSETGGLIRFTGTPEENP